LRGRAPCAVRVLRQLAAPLSLVGVEQFWSASTLKDEGELPAQVDHVLHRCVHALATGWAVYVRGVAAVKYASDAQRGQVVAVDPKA
jgi:hypothetical protein